MCPVFINQLPFGHLKIYYNFYPELPATIKGQNVQNDLEYLDFGPTSIDPHENLLTRLFFLTFASIFSIIKKMFKRTLEIHFVLILVGAI